MYRNQKSCENKQVAIHPSIKAISSLYTSYKASFSKPRLSDLQSASQHKFRNSILVTQIGDLGNAPKSQLGTPKYDKGIICRKVAPIKSRYSHLNTLKAQEHFFRQMDEVLDTRTNRNPATQKDGESEGVQLGAQSWWLPRQDPLENIHSGVSALKSILSEFSNNCS